MNFVALHRVKFHSDSDKFDAVFRVNKLECFIYKRTLPKMYYILKKKINNFTAKKILL